jgi:hypothetical protein
MRAVRMRRQPLRHCGQLLSCASFDDHCLDPTLARRRRQLDLHAAQGDGDAVGGNRDGFRKRESPATWAKASPRQLRFPSIFARNRSADKITTMARLRQFPRHKKINLLRYRKATTP